MARSFVSLALQTARAVERNRRAEERYQQRFMRQQQQVERQAFLFSRQSQCDQMNADTMARVSELSSILANSLERYPTISWNELEALAAKVDRPDASFEPPPKPTLELPKSPSALGLILPGAKARHEAKTRAAQAAFDEQLADYKRAHRRWQLEMNRLAAEGHKRLRDLKQFQQAYATRLPEAVVAYVEMAIERSDLPEGCPEGCKVVYVPESQLIVIDYPLPTIEAVIPPIEKYRYVKSRDAIEETPRAKRSTQALYQSVIAQLAIRAVSEIFRADTDEVITAVALNGFVDTIDPRTGNPIRPCLISLRTSRDQFSGLNLHQVDPIACLKYLNASLSRSPTELTPVKPIVEFDMSDPRYIQEEDVINRLDQRTNLMDLSPTEFENLITNLFQKMGLETKLTQASRDGGVDCVAYDQRPILGGKVVIQAKRYKNTVGVSSVRDLFGTMHNEGANKGILVTTSGFGKSAFEFANGKPLELISGSNLLHLLKEYADLEAKIEAPDGWKDEIGGVGN